MNEHVCEIVEHQSWFSFPSALSSSQLRLLALLTHMWASLHFVNVKWRSDTDWPLSMSACRPFLKCYSSLVRQQMGKSLCTDHLLAPDTWMGCTISMLWVLLCMATRKYDDHSLVAEVVFALFHLVGNVQKMKEKKSRKQCRWLNLYL